MTTTDGRVWPGCHCATEDKMNDKKKSPPEKEAEKLAKLEAQITALEEENGKLHESYLRLAAEFDNYKKRQSKNFGEMVSAARDALLLKMLDVFDNFERAIDSSDEPPSAEALIEGIRLIHKQFEDMLKSERIDAVCEVGDDFDPSMHEAVALVPSDDCEN
ncbi:MAG TPA: nucleotide exchange factor GrpE, partial [candidate division Zixibacteria bacterium]|nr:nucleotide exchange factor GrpE [candidate division Zixibacteria bacterium]